MHLHNKKKGFIAMRLVPISCIKEDTLLAKTIYDIDGRILLKRGVPLNEKLILKIHKYGIQSLYIDDNYSHKEIKEIIKPEIKRRAFKTIKSTFDKLKKQKDHFDGSGMDNVSILSKIANDIVNDLLSQNQIFINLVDIKTMDNYTYEHSLSVALLSLILGVEMGLDRTELCDLCVGAMLHDVGKIFVPLDILNKPSTLTQHEYEIIRNHTICGYDYLYKDHTVKSSSRLIALQHHEACDGTGYPKGLLPSKIHKFSKIVAIADIYDAMTSDRPYRPGIQPHEVIEYIMGNAGGRFDYDMVVSFVRKIMPYPVGTLVELSTGHYAFVEEINVNYPLRPIVCIKDPSDETIDGKIINLLEITNIVIRRIQYDMPDSNQKNLYRISQ